MTVGKHVFTIEVTALPHAPHKSPAAEQGWKSEVETAIAKRLLYTEGSFSAITRVINPTSKPGRGS